MPPILPAPVLTVAPDALKDLDGSDHLSGLWFVFTKCKTSLHDGRRLENISWRLWYRELASLSSYRPLTPDTPSELATKATSMPFTTPNRRTGRTGTSLPSSLGASSFHQPIGRVIYEMLPGSSPETTRVLNSKLRLPSNFPATPEAEPSIAIILPETEPTTAVSSSSSASSPALSPTFTRPPPIHPTSHSSPSLSSTSNHSSSGPGPLVVVVNPTPNPTPHPTPPATPILPQTTLPASGESNHQAEVSIYGRQVQLPQQPTLSRQAGKHLLPPVQVSNFSSQPPTRPPIPSSLLLPPSPTSNSNDSASSVSGSPFTAVTDTSSSTSYHDDSTLKPTDAKKFIVGMSHDRDHSSQSSESPTSSQDGYASTVGYPYHRQTVDHPQGLAKTNQKSTFTLNSGLHHPYSSETLPQHVSTQSRIQSQPKHDAHSQSQAPSHLYPQSSRSQSHSHSRSQSEAVLQQQSYVHTHAPYPSNHSLVKIRGESSASGTVAASNAFMAGGSGNGGKTGHTTSTATTIGTTTSATSTSSTNSASGSDLRSRNRNQRLPSVPNGTVAHASMNVQQKSGGVGSHPGRRASEDSELSDSWSESESEEEEGRDKRERATNGNALSNSMDSTNASVSGKSAGSGSRLVTRSRGRTDRHSGLMMSAKGKRKNGAGDQHTVGRKSGRQATGYHGLGMTAKPALPQTQAQGAVARGQNEVKDSYDAQGRAQANGKQKERTDSATGSVASTSGPGGPNRDMGHTELDRKKEREQTVTKKTMQMLSKGLVDQGSGLESATVAEGSSKSSQLPHGVAAPTTTSIMPSTLAPAMAPAPYHQMSAKLAPVASSAAPTAPCTRSKAMFNIGSHSSDGDQSKSGLSVSTGPGGSDIRSNSNEGSMSLERMPGDGVSGLARTTAYDDLRVEPMVPVSTGEKKSEKAGSSRPQSRRASDAARPSTGPSKQAQQQAAPTQLSQQPPTAAATTTSNQHHAAPKPPLQQSSSRTSLPPVVGGLLPQPTTNEAIAAATALVEQNQQRQGGRRVVIDTDEDDEEEEEGAVIEEDDDDDSDYVTDEDDGDWTSDDASGNEVVPSVKGSKASSDGRATTVAAGQEKTSAAAGQKGQGHTQGQLSPAPAQKPQQQQQQAVAGPSGLQRPAMHNRHLSQPNVPTVAGLAKVRQQNQLQMEYDEQRKQLQAQQQQLALQQQQHQAQIRAHGLQRTASRRERERELARQRDDINIREAVLEAQRKRDMFAKVPERSYSNLTRSKSGLLSQLMNPDPQIFPPNHPYRKGYSSGDVVSGGGAGRGVMRLGIAPMTLMGGQQGNGQQQPVARGGISAMAPPKDGGQGRGRGGQGPVQPKPPVAAMSPPAMLAALKPTKSAAAPVANQVTAASVKDGGMVKGKEKEREKEKESTSNGGAKYRPKGKPEDQEMETESEDEGTNALQGSVTAKERLEKLFKTSSTGSSKQQQTQAQQQQQQRRPPALRQAYTEEPVRNQPMPPSPVPMQRSHSQIIPGVPLGYPYNLPPAPAPSSPRTTRQRMLREEMSESVRQNLLWHRQLSKAVVLGPRRRSSEHSGLQPLTSITTVPSIVHLERRRTPPPDTPTDQGANENGDGGVGGSGNAVSGAGAAGVAMTFHDRPVPMTRTRSWAGGGR